MKKIVCELCEGTEFTKEGGFFVCHGCGTKYSLEEAKSMMKEVEGEAAPIASSAPVAPIPTINPNQAQIDNILVLATTAYEAQNFKEAENYCNRAIELDAMCYKAWNLKGKAVGWSSKMDNMRVEEAAHSFCKAIDFAPEDEKEDLKNQASEELKKLGLAIIATRKNRFIASPDTDELNGFTHDKKVLLDALLVLLQHGNAVGIPEGYLDQIAVMMNDAAVGGLNTARTAWNKVKYPTEKDLTIYLDWNGNICTLLRQAISTSNDDDEADITRYKNLNTALEDPIGKYSYTSQWNSYLSRYDQVRDKCLADSAVKNRRDEVSRNKTTIANLERTTREKKAAAAKKAEEEKKARIAAYWAAHADEKASLENEKKQLIERKDILNKDIGEVVRKITAAEEEKKSKVSSEVESDKIRNQIRDLENRRSNLGMFAGKEKKQIGEEIASLQGRVESLRSKIDGEKKTRDATVDKNIAPAKAKRDELNTELSKVTKRIAAIDAEFIKDPGE